MPEVVTIIFDNSLNSQNQDYLPSRYVLQKEVIDFLITRIQENDIESLVGLIPLAQRDQNDLITPTNSRKNLTTFLLRKDLSGNINRKLTLLQANWSLYTSEYSDKSLYIFMGTQIENFEEHIADIYNLAANNLVLKIICFAEAIEFGNLMLSDATFGNISVCIVGPEEDFNEKVNSFFISGNQKLQDPYIEEAIRRSLAEK